MYFLLSYVQTKNKINVFNLIKYPKHLVINSNKFNLFKKGIIFFFSKFDCKTKYAKIELLQNMLSLSSLLNKSENVEIYVFLMITTKYILKVILKV